MSGGERKRVNIACELVTDPSLIFLDEPTSGLDSFNAQNVMSTLLNLAKNDRTVVATIHQPRSSIYQMFDKLMLLSEGQTMYFGQASEAVTYFGSLGYSCPSVFNPADYFVDLVSLDQRTPERREKTEKRISALADAFTSHSAKAAGESFHPTAEISKETNQLVRSLCYISFKHDCHTDAPGVDPRTCCPLNCPTGVSHLAHSEVRVIMDVPVLALVKAVAEDDVARKGQ